MDDLLTYPFEWTKNEQPLFDVLEAEDRGEDKKYIRFNMKNPCQLNNKNNLYKSSIPCGGDMFTGIILDSEDYKNVENITIRTGEFVDGHTTIIEKLSKEQIEKLCSNEEVDNNQKNIMINRLPLICLAFTPILIEIETEKSIKYIDVIYEHCCNGIRKEFGKKISEGLIYVNTKKEEFVIQSGLISK